MYYEPTHKYEVIKEDEYLLKMPEITGIIGEYMTSGYFVSFDNTNMYYEYFKVANPRGNIVVVHGYTEFTKKYYELTWYFMNMGFNVFLYDIRCHGNSHRGVKNPQMTHVESYNDYAKDLECYINDIADANSDGKPIYLFAHSMGAAVAALYLENHKNNVEKVVFSSAMIYPFTPPLPRFVLKRLLTKEAEKCGWESRFKFSSDFNPNAKIEGSNDLSRARFEYNLKFRLENPLYQNSFATNRWNYEAITVCERILNKKAVKNITAKALVITAGMDKAVKVRPQKRFAKLLKCEQIIFRDSRHSLYTQTGAPLEEFIDTVINFFCKD